MSWLDLIFIAQIMSPRGPTIGGHHCQKPAPHPPKVTSKATAFYKPTNLNTGSHRCHPRLSCPSETEMLFPYHIASTLRLSFLIYLLRLRNTYTNRTILQCQLSPSRSHLKYGLYSQQPSGMPPVPAHALHRNSPNHQIRRGGKATA